MHRTPRDILARMITRSDSPEQKITGRYWPLVAGAILSALVVAVTAFSASYQHQYELNIRYGQAHWVAGMQPLSVEGLITATTLAIWYSALLKRKARDVWPAYLILLIALAQAALMNLAADHRFNWPWIGPEISIWPAAAFFAAYEMAVWVMRHRPEPKVNETQPGTTAPPTPDVSPLPELRPRLVDVGGLPHVTAQSVVNGTPATEPEVASWDEPLPDEEPVHTCNGGQGPKGGKKTPGCPRCDALIAGTVLPKGGAARRR